MGSLIGLVNRIQRACTVLGDHGGGGEGSLWEALPSVAVVGGQVRAAAASLPDPLAPVPDLASALAHGLVLVFSLSLLMMPPEFREVFCPREHSGEGLPASWIW